MGKIPSVIITTPSSDRAKPLIQSLEKSKIFEIVLISATMGYQLGIPSTHDTASQLKNYGRVLSPNERACAISHNNAREIVAKSRHGGVIFEDDARILNLSLLEEVVEKFLGFNLGENKILSLLNYKVGTNKRLNTSNLGNLIFIPLLAEAPLAVATVQTNIAAADLVGTSMDTSKVADWPKCKAKFYVLRFPVVNHGDASTISIIGNTEERVQAKSSLSIKRGKLTQTFLRIRRKIDLLIIHLFQIAI